MKVSTIIPLDRLFCLLRSIPLLLVCIFTDIHAQTLWTGAVDNSWSNPDNWSNGVPGTTPGSGSVVAIGGNDLTDTSPITLDNVYYLNSLSIAADDYQVNVKEFFQNGTDGSKIVFEAVNGTGPTLTYAQIAASGAAQRNIAIGADIEIADDLTITRTTVPGSTDFLRRMQLNGVISGDGNLVLAVPSTSTGARLEFNNHNTFTGDINMQRGYFSLRYADSLGTAGKNVTVGSTATLITLDLASADITEAVDYNFNIANQTTTSENGYFLIQASTTQRQLEIAGDITGASVHTAAHTSLNLIAQGNQQMVFTSGNSTFGGRVIVRFGSEVVLAGANAENIAWENVAMISMGRSMTGSAVGNNSAFLLRGNYTLNAALEYVDTDGIAARDRASIGQVNHEGTSYDATFNGNIRILENDYKTLNLVSESGGSATFNGEIAVTGGQGMDINNLINATTSAEAIGYYETSPTGTVIISGGSRVSSAIGGTGSIGTTDLRSGTLIINTQDFYGNVTVRDRARLGGLGRINGNVIVQSGGVIETGFGSTSPTFTSETGMMWVTGNVTLDAGSSILFQVNGTDMNVGDLAIEDIATFYGADLEFASGDYDHLGIQGTLNAAAEKSLKVAAGEYEFKVGDVFRFIDFTALNLSGSASDYASLWDLPELSHIDPAMKWSLDLLDDYGVLVVVVPEPGKIMLCGMALGVLIFRRRRPASRKN